MKITTLTINQLADAFFSSYQEGMHAFVKAGAAVADGVDAFGQDYRDLVMKKCKDITPEVLRRFEGVGRKQKYAALITSTAPGVNKLLTLPYSLQEKYATEPIPLVILKDNGADVIKADVRDLTPPQAAQVFDKDGVRSEAAQRLWLEDRREKKAAQPARQQANYRIYGNRVNINGVEFTAKELARILAEIQK